MADAPASTALATRDASDLVLSDDEIRRTFRVAEALALSGMFKDSKRAEQAFAKIILGRDLGLTPAQSMQGIHVVEGGIQLHYSTIGNFIRQRDGYDFRAGWLKTQKWAVLPDSGEVVEVLREEEGSLVIREPGGAVTSVLAVERSWEEAVVVWHDEEDPEDLRPVVGAVVDFTVNGVRRGISRYTEDDARQAGLIKEDKRAAWNTSRRNMLLARAMSNGGKWFVPEVLGGIPVYTAGEIPEKPSLTAAVGAGTDEGTGIDLGPKVDRVIERAAELGHAGLSNRAVAEVALGNRAPAVVNQWVAQMTRELDRFEEEKAEGVTDAEVVPDDGGVEDSIARDEAHGEVADEPMDDAEFEVLNRRLKRLRELTPADPDQQEEINAEIAHIESQLEPR